MNEFIELQAIEGAVWVRADKIVGVLEYKFGHMGGGRFHHANGSRLLLQLSPGELDVFERPSEVLAKIAEATNESRP